jgi:quercetin dioxygenase-like cupin family protein
VTTGQRLLGQADFADVPPPPARLTTTQLTLAPGASTQPFANPGPVLIVVQDGTVTLNADAALIGEPPEPQVGISVTVATPPPAPAQDVAVTKGEQIAIEANTNAQLRNAGDAPVRLLLVTLVAQPADA